MKTAVFIPVRTRSTRLPDKALLEIKGRPIIEYLIERVKSARLPDLVVLCTTRNTEDSRLVEIARRNNIDCFRGSEKDIVDRYLKAALKHKVDFIVIAEGDDVLCDPEYIDRVIELFVRSSADFITCEGLPFGAAPSGIRVEALKRVYQLKKETDTETGWKRYFTESGLFKVEHIDADKELNHPEFRMSLDYPEDFQFFKAVFERLYVPGRVFSLREIVSLLHNNPDIVNLNKHRQDEYWKAYYDRACGIDLKEGSE